MHCACTNHDSPPTRICLVHERDLPLWKITVYRIRHSLKCTCRNINSIYRRIYIKTPILTVGRDSSVGIATRYGLDGPGIESQWGARFSAPVQNRPAAHPAPYTMGNGSLPGGVKRPERGVDHPPHLEQS